MDRTQGACVTACERCPALVESRERIVNGAGPPEADLLFLGEAPGATEDAEGDPFVGRSGDVLDAALSAVGVAREDVRITNCVRCRPPENRDPTREELGNCREYLDAEVAGVAPDVVVTLGKVPSEHLLGRSVAVTEEVGTVAEAEFAGSARRVLVCLHPAATLYDSSQRDPFERAVAAAADLAGVAGASDQSRLGEF